MRRGVMAVGGLARPTGQTEGAFQAQLPGGSFDPGRLVKGRAAAERARGRKNVTVSGGFRFMDLLVSNSKGPDHVVEHASSSGRIDSPVFPAAAGSSVAAPRRPPAA